MIDINLPFLEKNFLAIDLGSLNIKIIEGRKRKNELEITNVGLIPVFNFKTVSSTSYILEENLATIISSFLKESQIKAKNTFINVPYFNTFNINFLVPNIPEKSLPNVVKFEAQKQLPLSLEEIEIDFRYFPFESEGEKKWLIFLSAIPKNYLAKLENIVSLSHLKNQGYGIESFSFEPYFKDINGNFLVIDLGHSHSSYFLLKDGKLLSSNKLQIMGYDLVDSMARMMQTIEQDTLEILKKRGFLFNPEERELRSISQNFLNNLVSLLQEEINKLENSFYLRIEKIYFTGGVSILPGFQENTLEKLSSYKQEILNPANFVLGEKFKNLGLKATLFSSLVGLLFKKSFTLKFK